MIKEASLGPFNSDKRRASSILKEKNVETNKAIYKTTSYHPNMSAKFENFEKDFDDKKWFSPNTGA